MKKIFSSLIVLFFVQLATANTLYDQLCDFNYNWKKYELRAPIGEAVNFSSDKELIQAHLTNVLEILRSNSVSHLNDEQLKSRVHLIEVLDGYRMAGLFPMNYYRQERIPVFIDEHNTHCAVGFLIRETGNEEMARRIAAVNNYAWVKEINVDGVLEWQEESGFTLEEIKLIQGAYEYYDPIAFTLPNKHEVPQKPVCIAEYFEHPMTGKKMDPKPENIWLYGEGKNDVLNGRWIQNYAVDIPWIVGFYINGKRSGQWKEYYQGTNLLCRTENWRNDKLNGIRKRFDRKGIVIEEILFKDGEAVTKTNHDFVDSLTWIRRPLDSNLVWTEVYTFGGAMIASGHERIYNPGNLLWFQNIELTALNSASITSRDASVSYQGGVQQRLFSSPPLVQYKKEGEWVYFKEYGGDNNVNSLAKMFHQHFPHFGNDLYSSVSIFDDLKLKSSYDSIRVEYDNNYVQNFYGYGEKDYTHLQIKYYNQQLQMLYLPQFIDQYGYSSGSTSSYKAPLTVKELGQFNKSKMKIGTWKYFDKDKQLYKTESFIIPRKEETPIDEKSEASAG